MNIYLKQLSVLQTNIHYYNRYVKLIQYCNERISNETYHENHHILPKSLGGDNSSENLIKLTAREHFLAHWMLWKMSGSQSMTHAFWLMSHQADIRITAKTYSVLREARRNCMLNKKRIYNSTTDTELSYSPDTELPEGFKLGRRAVSEETKIKMSKIFTGSGNPFYGKTHTDETKDIISIANTGKEMSIEAKEKIKIALTGRQVSETTRKLLSDNKKGEKNHFFGKKHTEETKEKMSKASSSKRCIRNIKTNEFMRIDENTELPFGWEYGGNPRSDASRLKASNSAKGKHKIHNPKTGESKFVYDTSNLEEGWVIGGMKASSETRKRQSESMQGKMRIYNQDTKEIKFINKSDIIPLGFVRGSKPMSEDCKKLLSTAIKNTRHIINIYTGERRRIRSDDTLPDGWIYGRTKK